MKEIFEKQHEFNTLVLAKLGLDYAQVLQDSELIPIWIENYRKALSSELAELIREVQKNGLRTSDGKIEIIDMLHFLVSLSQLVEINHAQATNVPLVCPKPNKFYHYYSNTFLALDYLQNSLKWKWWAKGGGYKPAKAQQAVLKLWQCFWYFCFLWGMDFDEVKRIYLEKNKVNFKRQEKGYSEDTKDEGDNSDLAAKISSQNER